MTYEFTVVKQELFNLKFNNEDIITQEVDELPWDTLNGDTEVHSTDLFRLIPETFTLDELRTFSEILVDYVKLVTPKEKAVRKPKTSVKLNKPTKKVKKV